ncbi:RagB/SusD family nutrient uptake outer membrane protein [Hoylesella pleuritidis]|jgi:hypothetical protein|uniref:RagB/SusD family nutrient uptake outer membrane protein n=1 Tax=Hoylesella pleuritidis TaxID=407975 RepID=UPI0028E6E058|nr:RagB/SusD family nutrient uptake outer membrane protein [Hoylesella pleuritidis]
MKYYNILIASLLTLSVTTACDKFLDVLPSTEKEKREMFSTLDGCRSVLIGAYIRMKQTNLYGQEMVCGSIENLAQHWTYTSGSIGEYLNKYDYKANTVETTMENIYNNLFKVVADVNGLLDGIESNRKILDNSNYNLLKGEALALRAFCHFDILRLFGPMPNNVPASKILPYVTVVSNKPNAFITYTEFTSQLLKDLDNAEACLTRIDPIKSKSIEALNQTSAQADNFFGYRQMRMNYYAVCALKARIYLWIGNKEKALEYAKLVIDATTPGGDKTFRLGTRDDCSRGNKTLSTEHIFDLKVNNLSATLGSGRSYQKSKTELTSRLYETGTSDIRFVNMWEEVTADYRKSFYFQKYVQTEKMPPLSKNVIPIIRLAEMYLIALECSSLTDANSYYATLCAARDITPANITDEEQRTKVLIQEYNKEFYGEGQTFYAYKRLAVKDIYWAAVPGSVETYVVPLPLKEAVYAN